jgi:flagella basal body P-ring formation protein FlgA
VIRSAAGALLLLAALAAPAAAQAGATAAPAGPVAARDIERGTVLVAEDVTFPEGAQPDSTGAPVGWVARRVITAGEELRAPAVQPQDLVRVGDAVQAVFAEDGLELRLIGRAMGAGRAGERVMIRIDTHRRFEGVVVGPRLVRIDIPDRSRT